MHPNYRPAEKDATRPFTEVATLRDWFALHAPEPSAAAVNMVMQMEQQANPHNDSYKPKRRGDAEIKCALRYKFADEMLKVRSDGDRDRG